MNIAYEINNIQQIKWYMQTAHYIKSKVADMKETFFFLCARSEEKFKGVERNCVNL
jgi:hypothetical protein